MSESGSIMKGSQLSQQTALDKTLNSLLHGHLKLNFPCTETSHRTSTDFNSSMILAYEYVFSERMKT